MLTRLIGMVGRSISAVRTLCTIIPFDPEAKRKISQEKKIGLGEADMFEIVRQFVRRRFGEVKQT